MKYTLNQILEQYNKRNTDNLYEPVAVGKYGIRKRSDIYKKELSDDYSKNKLIYKDTMTIGMGSKQIDFGVLTEEATYSVSPAYTTFKINTTIISAEYLELYLEANNCYYTQKHMIASARQGKKVDVVNLLNEEIDVPNFEKQNEIEKNISIIKSAKEKDELLLQLMDELVNAQFTELFGDTVSNSMGWEEHSLDEYIDFLTSGSRGWAQYYVDVENELFITIKNVKNKHITLDNIQYINAPNNKEAERTKVREGDLLISITADLGRTGVVDNEIAERGAYINQHLSLVRLNQEKINPMFVSYFLETEGGKRQFDKKNQTGVKAGLNFDAIKSLKILVPPREIQEEYLDFVKQVDKSKSEVQKRIELYEELVNKKMNDYFID
jgi:type I restriction enzyme S subunit